MAAERKHTFEVAIPLLSRVGSMGADDAGWVLASASLNVAATTYSDLYSCERPVRYYEGVPSLSPIPKRYNRHFSRENTEDVYRD